MVFIEGLLAKVGAVCFAACAVPQAVLSMRNKNSEGMSYLFLWLWFAGEAMTIVYVLASVKGNIAPLMFNYLINFSCLLVILYYKHFPKRG